MLDATIPGWSHSTGMTVYTGRCFLYMAKETQLTENTSFEDRACFIRLNFPMGLRSHFLFIVICEEMRNDWRTQFWKSTKSSRMYLPVPAFSMYFLMLCFPDIQVGMEMAAVPVKFFLPWEMVISFAAIHKGDRHRFFVFFQCHSSTLIWWYLEVSSKNTLSNLCG